MHAYIRKSSLFRRGRRIMTIYNFLERIRNMSRIVHTGLSILLMFVVMLAADVPACIFMHAADRTESSSESQRECNTDENTGRCAPSVQPGMRQRLNIPGRHSFASTDKAPAVSVYLTALPHFGRATSETGCIALSSVFLRI